MATHKDIFVTSLLLLCSCSSPVDKIHDKVSEHKHKLPVISIVADSIDLFDDTIGIYSKGIGTAENWQGQKTGEGQVEVFAEVPPQGCVFYGR